MLSRNPLARGSVRVDGFVDDFVRVRGVVEEVTVVFVEWVVDEASRVAELVCDVDAVGVDAVFDEFVIVREEGKRFVMKTA